MKKFIPLSLIFICMLTIYLLGWHRYLSYEMIQNTHAQLLTWVASHLILAPLIFILIYALATTLSIPGGFILTILGGLLFGFPGALYVLIGATAGACGIFLATKYAFHERLEKKSKPYLKKLRAGFRKNATSYMLFLRLVPLFPFWLINIAPALLGVRFRAYLWTTFVGIIPGVFIYTQAGVALKTTLDQPLSIGSILNLQMRIALILIALLALIPVVVKWLRAK